MSNNFRVWFQDKTPYNGPQVPLNNTTATGEMVTAALLKKAFWGGTKALYQAGVSFLGLPVVIQANQTVAVGHADDERIDGIVVGSSELTPTDLNDSDDVDALNNYQLGDPEIVVIAPRGCGRFFVVEYTGTAPELFGGTFANTRVVTSATVGKVKVAADTNAALQIGTQVLDVDTTNSLCVIIL